MFDFLIPNFLGSIQSFAHQFGDPITRGQHPNASPEDIYEGMGKLKLLHQQVLPFVLRREKSQVLKELPPKNITTQYIDLTEVQLKFYSAIKKNQDLGSLVRLLETKIGEREGSGVTKSDKSQGGALRTLLALRLVCTHPILISSSLSGREQLRRHSLSGKFLALVDLLRSAGFSDCIVGVDNDDSLLYCNDSQESDEESDVFESISSGKDSSALVETISLRKPLKSKCLIFAQFNQTLDLIEELVLKPIFPSLGYLRLDGNVPAPKRVELSRRFNEEVSISVMLLTSRVGSLGLNLTGADLVIFIENDFNPFVDLQAMDRAHRIGQSRTVNVIRLVSKNSVEEAIMVLQEKKKAVADTIVNSENSSLYSMGTERLLDIFAGSRVQEEPQDTDLERLIESCVKDYLDLSVEKFLENFLETPGS